MNITKLTSTSGNDQFYPTPPELAKRMFEGVDWDSVNTILEPSAGKGNLVEAIGIEAFSTRDFRGHEYRREEKIDVDCIEIDPYLRSILKYQFSDERKEEVYKTLVPKNSYGNIIASDYTPLYRALDKTNARIVHDDFLTYRPYKPYDLIIMNPPFKEGDKHLLHALDIQRNGGGVVCLLNAETIRNPYSTTRTELQKRLNKHNAQIEYVTDGFKDAERSTDVEIAIIKVFIPAATEQSEIFDRLEKAAEAEEFTPNITDLVTRDFIEARVRQFNVECRAGIELIREWKAMSPYIMRSIDKASYNSPILQLSLNDSHDDISINNYLRMVRLKYWRGLFGNEEFMGKLTMKLRDQYLETVEKMADYDFSAFNIKDVMAVMNSQVMTGVQDEIFKTFDKLTAEHSYYPECSRNIHYYNGWKTNIAHKIGKKSIIPEYLQEYSWSRDAFDVGKAYGVLSDIEKIFDYLSGNMSHEPIKTDIRNALKIANENNQTRNIECTYFTVDIYKKGTVHIKYTYPELVDRLNIYAARNRNWLPPNYGKVRYSDMTSEEQAVVNDFHRSENEKEINPIKSAERYAAVMANPAFYIADPVRNVALLEGAGA